MALFIRNHRLLRLQNLEQKIRGSITAWVESD